MQMGDRSNPRSSLRIVPVGMDQSPQACDLREIDPCGQSGEGSFPVEQLVEIGGRERFGSVHCGYVLRFSDERSVSMGVLWNGQFDFMVSMIRMSLRIVPCGRTNPSFQAFISCRIDCASYSGLISHWNDRPASRKSKIFCSVAITVSPVSVSSNTRELRYSPL